MSTKIEINTDNGSILMNGTEISETVAEWSCAFSQGNLQASGGKSGFAVVLKRFVYDGDKMLLDDTGALTYNQVFYDVEISIKADGKYRQIIPGKGLNIKNLTRTKH